MGWERARGQVARKEHTGRARKTEIRKGGG